MGWAWRAWAALVAAARYLILLAWIAAAKAGGLLPVRDRSVQVLRRG